MMAPQFLINLGTGSSGRSEEAEDQCPPWPSERSLGRLCKAYMSMLAGKQTWKDFRNTSIESPLSKRFLRLDIQFKGAEPRLDDVDCIGELQEMVRSDTQLDKNINAAARRLIASRFYFELDGRPERRGKQFTGTGKIRCVIQDGHLASSDLKKLVKKLQDSQARLVVDSMWPSREVVYSIPHADDATFSCSVSFKNASSLSICLRTKEGVDYPISMATNSIERIMKLQGLGSKRPHLDGGQTKRCRIKRAK